MPKMVSIYANPAYDKRNDPVYAAIKKSGSKKVPYQTALENIRNSEGRYAIEPEKRDKPQRINTELEDMTNDDLKVMLLSLGIKTEKKMKKSDVITSIRTKLADVEILEDDADE